MRAKGLGAAALVLPALALAGCGGSAQDAGTSSTTPEPASTTREPASTAAEPAWRAAARTLDMPLYRIAGEPELTLGSVVPTTGCGDDATEQVVASYAGPGGDLVRLYEARPYFCGDVGDVRTLGTASVNGRPAVFLESPNSDDRGGMLLRWYTALRRERTRGPGSEMLLEVSGRDRERALRIARGLRLVDHSAADALARVSAIYGPYARARNSTPLLGNCFFVPATDRPCAGPPRDYVTPALRARLTRYANAGTGADPVICAQNIPYAISYGPPTVTGSTATVVVHVHWNSDDDQPIAVTVDLGTLKLTDVRC